MSDDTTEDRWTVRGVPKATQEVFKAAAQRRKVSVGAVVCQALDALLRDEREPMDLRAQRPVADNSSDTSNAGFEALSVVERIVSAAAVLANAHDVPKGIRGRANRALREMLPASVRVRRPPPALAAPASDA